MRSLSKRYVAGFIDGEGCIGFGRTRKTIFPRVLVVNTNRQILEQLQRQFAGDIYPIAHRKSGWKSSWSWRISWTQAVNFLDDLWPFLRIKRDQALVVFAWDENRPRKFGNVRDPQAEQFLVDQMHWLNKRGPNNDPSPLQLELQEIEQCRA